MTSSHRDGFLSRWSRRKVQAREGPLSEQDDPTLKNASLPVESGTFDPTSTSDVVTTEPLEDESPAREEPPPALTLGDVEVLTPESDFSRFVKVDVSPEVKNAALKKLFSDPHYNVMDGLDIYIDDYSNLEVLPAPMLKDMVSAHALKMFDTASEVSEARSDTEETKSDVDHNDPERQADVLTLADSSSDPLPTVEKRLLDERDPADPASSKTLG